MDLETIRLIVHIENLRISGMDDYRRAKYYADRLRDKSKEAARLEEELKILRSRNDGKA